MSRHIFPVISNRLIHSLSRQRKPMSQQSRNNVATKDCMLRLMAFLKILQLTFFNQHTNNSMQYFPPTQIILVKTLLIIKEPQFKYEQSHFISSLNIIQHDYHQGSQGMSTTNLFKFFCSKQNYIPFNFNYAFSLRTVREKRETPPYSTICLISLRRNDSK